MLSKVIEVIGRVILGLVVAFGLLFLIFTLAGLSSLLYLEYAPTNNINSAITCCSKQN